VYTNQFPKTSSEQFIEHDIEPHFIADDGPVMAADACQNALKRSIGKILYHAGFEEAQPSAVDAFTGIAADYFQKLMKTFNVYKESQKKSVNTTSGIQIQPHFTPEEVILHTLDESGHDVLGLDAYTREELDRHSSKLGTLQERMKLHLTELLRPALSGDAGNDGVGAFKDGSDQFTSGDFADDIGEDFFGFKALGLDKELGGALGVPFHLLQTRVRSQYQMQTQVTDSTTADLFEPPPPLEPVTKENIRDQIALVKNFFLAKLIANGDQPLVEDEDLPVKQKKPRPRLGASGKIVSAQKRPPKEQLALAKKKKKMEAEAKLNASPEKGGGSTNTTPAKKKSMSMPNGAVPNPAVLALAPSMERQDSMQSQAGTSQTDKDEPMGMMSPESIAP
jgi:transcriptional activator SPT7